MVSLFFDFFVLRSIRQCALGSLITFGDSALSSRY
jgi:hypothetical protein